MSRDKFCTAGASCRPVNRAVSVPAAAEDIDDASQRLMRARAAMAGPGGARWTSRAVVRYRHGTGGSNQLANALARLGIGPQGRG